MEYDVVSLGDWFPRTSILQVMQNNLHQQLYIHTRLSLGGFHISNEGRMDQKRVG